MAEWNEKKKVKSLNTTIQKPQGLHMTNEQSEEGSRESYRCMHLDHSQGSESSKSGHQITARFLDYSLAAINVQQRCFLWNDINNIVIYIAHF